MKSFMSVLALASLVSITACKKDYNAGYADGNAAGNAAGAGSTTDLYTKALSFMTDLQKHYAASTSSSSISFVKFGKEDKNYVVLKYTSYDPATYSPSTGAVTVLDQYYIAIDLKSYVGGQNLTGIVNYFSTNTLYSNLSDMGDGTFRCIGSAGCTNFSGASASSTMVFEKTQPSLRDLESAAALVEDLDIKNKAENLAAKFALSEERAFEVSKLLSQWNKLSHRRSMTDADAEAFSMELMGAKVSEVQKAYLKSLYGNTSELESLINRAAEVNGISSENMNRIVEELFF
jgi:hypothetical protein